MYEPKKAAPGYTNPRLTDIRGQKFGAWTVIGASHRNDNKQTVWPCRCDCGTERDVVGQPLRTGKTKSCGCLMGEFIAKSKRKHGGSANVLRHGVDRVSDQAAKKRNAGEIVSTRKRVVVQATLTYRRWVSMRRRVKDKDPKIWKYYGAKGVKVCDRWLNSFENFLSDMGECPEGLTLDRINPEGNYEPGNCRWATWSQQFRQRMMTEVCGTCHKLRQVCAADGEQRVSFTMDEVATVKHLLGDWGWEYSLKADRDKVVALCNRLGLNSLAEDMKV